MGHNKFDCIPLLLISYTYLLFVPFGEDGTKHRTRHGTFSTYASRVDRNPVRHFHSAWDQTPAGAVTPAGAFTTAGAVTLAGAFTPVGALIPDS
jgi:hypothetical protein